MSGSLPVQVASLARRSITRTLRQPALVIPALVFPTILLAINAGGLDSATELPGFPTDKYVTFALAICFVQGAIFAANSSGTNVASDIESGFFDRLSLTPLTRLALLLGQLAGVLVLGLIQAVTFILVGVVAGAGFEAGLPGVLVILAMALLLSLGFGGLGAFSALRTGSGEAVQGLFPLMFAALFLSSVSLPLDLIETDWFRTIATWNPVSYILDGIRSLLIEGWDAEALAWGFLASGGIAVLTLAGSAAAMRRRMTRT